MLAEQAAAVDPGRLGTSIGFLSFDAMHAFGSSDLAGPELAKRALDNAAATQPLGARVGVPAPAVAAQ